MSSQIPRVAILRSTPGVTEPRFQRVSHLFNQLGFTVFPFTWLRTANEQKMFMDPGQEQFSRIAAYGKGARNLLSQIEFQFSLWRNLNKLMPQIVYACDLDTYLIAQMWSRRKSAILIYDQFDPFSSRIRSKFGRCLLQKIEMLATKSAAIRICANIERIPNTQRNLWIELENAFDFEIPKVNPTLRNWTLLYGGVLQKDRGLIEACMVIGSSSQWNFLIRGYGPLSDELDELSLSAGNIDVQGYTPHEELMSLAGRCHLYLALYDPLEPQNVHTASNKLFEAAKIGIPILTSQGTRLSFLVDSYGLGWTIAYGDTTAFKNVLLERAEWTENRQTEFMKGCERYLQEHDSKGTISAIQQELLSLIEKSQIE